MTRQQARFDNIENERTTLQSIIFPNPANPSAAMLYLSVPEPTRGLREINPRCATQSGPQLHAEIRELSSVSFGTYFNAFPASYWQRWTVVSSVTLELVTSGSATLTIFKSNASGAQSAIHVEQLGGANLRTTIDLPLSSFGDGGWYWFDLLTDESALTIHSGRWVTDSKPTSSGALSVGITTYNKPEFCIKTLQVILRDSRLTNVLDRIFVVDQGSDQVRDQPAFIAAQKALGEKLQLIRQPNLGGSGGFSRSMAEVMRRDDSDFLLLLDDDVEVETESILRAFQFGRFCREPQLIGGHMFDLYNKTVIHAWAEVVRTNVFLWGPSFEAQHRHDFRTQGLTATPWMHARLDSDYNGWWMCLIPKRVIAELGYSLPLFIKWDDAEYGLRAKEAGYRTVSLPGVALWHISWLDKDDTQDWQVFFHTRNRIISGLLHANSRTGKRLLENNSRQDIKKLLNMQYYATQLTVDALKSVLEGPSGLHASMQSSMPDARSKASHFAETRVFNSGEWVPPTIRGRVLPSLKNEKENAPTGWRLALFAAKWVPIAWMRKSVAPEQTPAIEFPKPEAYWWEIPKYTSVLVGTADGSGKMWYRHDREQFRRLLRESRQLHRKIRRNWNSLAAEYRASAAQLVSDEAWQHTFDAGVTKC